MAAEDLCNIVVEFEEEKRGEGADLTVEVKKVLTEECIDEKDEISDSSYEFVGDGMEFDEADLMGKGAGDLKVENGHDREHDHDHSSVCVDSEVSGGSGEEKHCVNADEDCGSGKSGGEEGCDQVEVSVSGKFESYLVMESGNEVEDKEEVIVLSDEYAEEIPDLQIYTKEKEVLELHEKACNGGPEIVESNDQVVDSIVVTSTVVSIEQIDSALVKYEKESQLVITGDVGSEIIVSNTNGNCQEEEHSDDTSSDPVQQETEQAIPIEENSSDPNDCVTSEVVTANISLESSESDACNLTCVEVNGSALQDDYNKLKVNPVDNGADVENHVICSQSSTDICVEDENIISSSSREMVLESMDDNTNAVGEKDLECEVEPQNIKNGENVSTIHADNIDLENSIENASTEKEVVTCSVEEIESKFETTQALIEQWERVDDKDEATSADIETLTSSSPDNEQVQKSEDGHVSIESCKDLCAEQSEIISKEDDSTFVDNETLASSSPDNEEEQKTMDTQINIETGKDVRLEQSEVVGNGNVSKGGDADETLTSSSADKGEEQQTDDTDVVIGGRNDFDAEKSESVCKEDESSSNTKTLSSPKPDDERGQRKEDTQVRLEMSKDIDTDQSEIARKEDESTSWGIECGTLPLESADAVNRLPEQTSASEPKRIPCYMIRLPRFSDNNLMAQKDNLEIQVDETTKSRDSLKLVIQNQKATRDECSNQLDAARKQEKTAIDLFNAKRQEINSIQNTFDMMKSATSIDEIDDKINVLEHRIQHETIPLKEEKQLIREIKALKQTRDKISCTLGSQAEVLEAFEQKHQIEEQFENLKQELNSLRREMLQLQLNTKSIKKKYDDECQALRDLYAQRDAANDLRQQTYSGLWSVKKEIHGMNAHFYQYKDDKRSAESLVTSGDKEALKHLCANQVEKFMELWNRNDEFRNQYVKFNMSSTVRRFKTLDGRSLGPDEAPIVLPNKIDEKLKNASLPPSKDDTSIPSEGNLVTTGEPITTKNIELHVPRTVKQKKLSDTSQQSPEFVVQDAPVMTASSEPVTEEVETEKMKTKKVGKVSSEIIWVEEKKNKPEEDDLTREANEVARQEEELKKERAAAEFKEKIRLEQIAKAKEAMERKKRQAEKAKARAELKAQREAELKEKKMAKKESQKEKKMPGTADATNAVGEGESSVPEFSTSNHNTPQEPEMKGTSASKRTLSAKQNNKSKALPLPLRSRSKRKMQTWMWFALIAAVVLLLFFVSNYVSFGEFKLSNFGF